MTKCLEDEEEAERRLDREYWAPLKRELDQLTSGMTLFATSYALRTVRRSMRFSYFSPRTMRWT